jgi:hypothetical protein
MNILRIINTILLSGILATLILIFLGLQQPIKVHEPVSIQGWSEYESPGEREQRARNGILQARSVPVTIVND